MNTPDAYDVVVVGGGGAGMAAALSAAEAGGEVLVAQKDDALGGITAMAMGSFAAAETDLQAAAGIRDSADAHFEDLGKFVASAASGPNRHIAYQHAVDPRESDDLTLRRLLVENAADTLAWLRDRGCEYVGPYEEGRHRVPRMHVLTNRYEDVLPERLNEAGVEVRTGVAAVGLVTEGGGVTGVELAATEDVDDGGTEPPKVNGATETVHATGGVVLATGGFVGNPALRAQYGGDPAPEGIYGPNTGDGHLLAQSVGARLVNMDSQSLFLRCEDPLWTGPDFASLVDEGAVLVNADGERFVDELADYDQVFSATLDQPERRLYVLFDAEVAETFSSWPNYISTYAGKPWGYVEDYVEAGFLVREESLADLAGHLSDADTLEATVERYNEGVDYPGAGRRDPYGRSAHHETLRGPWYLLGPMRPYAATTNGGVDVDDRLRALDGDGTPIPGLYAAGTVGGGVHLFGHGHHHAWIFTSGRLAGEHALAGE